MFRQTGIFSTRTIEDARAEQIADQKGYLYASVFTFFERSDEFSSYFIFVDKVQDFWHGKTYLPNLYAPIPRLIWPQKPVTTDLNAIGREYGLIDKFDIVTSPGIGKYAEAYFNFGYVGLFGLGIFLSLFMLTIFKYLLTNKTIWGIAIAFIPVFMFFTFAQAPLGGLVADIIKLLIVFSFIRIIIKALK
jgi:hypothetical protein